ncbi:MAG: CocE/NonD family hydrolase [Bryobacteraceae bacterium]|jgi:putative CocE/NonD family hydrolase
MLRAALSFLLLAVALCGQGAEFIRANYTKHEYLIPMRDGQRLFTAVYLPKDTAQPWPILLERTPYGVAPYGEDNYPDSLGPSPLFAKAKYIFVYQDVRGRFMSEGEFVDMRPIIENKRGAGDVDESSDTWDTLEWLLKHVPGNNGKAGQWGISYPGFYAAAGLVHAHPALRAVSPQAPITDWFIGDDFHHNGALWLPHAFRFYSEFGVPRTQPLTKYPPRSFTIPDTGYEFYLDMGALPATNDKFLKGGVTFWNELMQHDTYDEFWQARNLRPHLKNIRPAVLTVGGWFDAEDLFGALETFKSIEKQGHSDANVLVMGPWYHGGWERSDGDRLGPVRFNAKTSEYFRESVEFPFFEYFLKGKGELNLPKAVVFETGANVWRAYDAWPPKNAEPRTLYLHANGRLSFDPPAAGEPSAFDEYVSDPNKPVPFISEQASGMTREYMVEDQRFASTRTDVLTWETEPLTGDITFAGPVSPSLHVSTSGTDSDFVVKLIDVYPADAPNPEPNPTGVVMAGYQQLVRGEVMRGKFRASFTKPEPFTPGQVTKIEYVMPDVNHTFRRGHRIMVQIQSTWFPLVDRNPQQFLDIYTAKPSDFQKTTERVYHSAEAPSGVTVDVIR